VLETLVSAEAADLLRLDGQVALVSGASAGIGKSVARTLALAGASVCLVAREQVRLDEAVRELEETGARAIGVAGSVLDAATRELSVRRCVDELGSLDVLVNNVGVALPATPIAELDEDTVRSLTALNLDVSLFYSQLAWRAWMSEHGGSIVNITSASGRQPRPGYGWYGVTKAALAFLTQVLALEFAPKVRVNAIAPGIIKTEMMMANTTPEFRTRVMNQRPLRRHGEVGHIATAVLLLVAPSGGYTTGHELAIDGGAQLI
jgi:3-oxoacyl-[acyl-carrier protein] reductase